MTICVHYVYMGGMATTLTHTTADQLTLGVTIIEPDSRTGSTVTVQMLFTDGLGVHVGGPRSTGGSALYLLYPASPVTVLS